MTLEAANHVLEAMRSRNRIDYGKKPPIPIRPERTSPPRVHTPDDVSKPILAARRGTCAICHQRIWEGNDQELGDEIVHVLGRGWAHIHCADDLQEAA